MSIEVLWRSGKRSEIQDAKAGRIYEVEEPADAPTPVDPPQSRPVRKLFEDVSASIQHWHHEEVFDDFARQPLLPRRMSQMGPGVSFCDLDGDGHDDLFVGTGRGGIPSIFIGSGPAGFHTNRTAAVRLEPSDDLLGTALLSDGSAKRSLLVSRSNYEASRTAPGTVQSISLPPGSARISQLKLDLDDSVPSALAVADVDGDGLLDLFVGGRLRPGRYPEPATSALFHQTPEGWIKDEQLAALLEPGLLVSAAVFSDLNGDGFPELILACDWGPVRVFLNTKGRFKEITADVGLQHENGWWNCITIVDLDGDGQMDLIAGGWGLNTPWHASASEPLLAYHGDFDGNGVWDLLEAREDRFLGKAVPLRNFEVIGKALPLTRLIFPTHHAYAAAAVSEILGEAIPRAKVLTAHTLMTRAWINRGGKFVARELPAEVQWAPVFGIAVADFDGDGNEDVFFSQNFFAMRPEDPRLDAGRGLLLRGKADGDMAPCSMEESGIQVFGEQRGVAVGDFDEDGRTDLVVSQNGSQTRLFRNIAAKPGLRVRLAGPSGNPDGIGANLRLGSASKFGPAREIHGGGGSLSQDSVVPVLAFFGNGMDQVLQIRWPGGRVTRSEVPNGAREVRMDATGNLQLIR